MSADDIWNDLFGGFDRFNRQIEDMFNRMDMTGPDVRTYGYTMWQGPDGVKHVKEFGNSGDRIGMIPSSGAKDSFVDVSEEPELVRAVAELPGAEKQDISLTCTDKVLSVKVTTPGRELEKDIALPCDVDPETAKASYNNGLLEVTLKKVSPLTGGRKISIE